MKMQRFPPSGNDVDIGDLLKSRDADFSDSFSRWIGLPQDQIILVNSGAAAFHLALLGMRLLNPRRKKVILPAWCCPSVPQAVLQAGLLPVLADLSPQTLGYAEADLRRVCLQEGEPPLAVLHAHFFGIPQTPGAASQEASFEIRDLAQDFNYRPSSADGLPCFYSFARGKALNAGHGGALCFPGPSVLLEACREIVRGWSYDNDWSFIKVSAINLLSQPRLYWIPERMPFLALGRTVWKAPLHFARMAPQFQGPGSACLAAYGKRLGYFQELTGRYLSLFSRCDKDKVTLPFSGHPFRAHQGRTGEAGVPLRFPLLIRDAKTRNDLYQDLNERFGGVSRMYPDVLPRLENAPSGLFPKRRYPGAEAVARGMLTLPVTSRMRDFEGRFLRILHHVLMDHSLLRAGARAAA